MADWYLKHGDKEYGPMDSTKLKQLAAQNKIRPTDYIRRGADGKWTLASHAKGLFNDAASNDPSAPSPINVHSGDANVGSPLPVPPIAPTPNPAFTQTPNVQMPVAPPIASAIPVAQKAPSASSSMSFGDGLEFTSNSASSPSSPQKGKKGKKKASGSMDNKTVLIAAIAGGAVFLLIVVSVLIYVLSNKSDKTAPAADNQEVAQSEGDTAPKNGENADNAATDENAPADENALADETPEAKPEEDSEQPVEAFTPPKDAIYSETGVAKCGDVEIKIVSLKQGVEPITEKDGVESESPDRSTIITLSVKNINDKKTVTFTPWSVQIANGKKNSVLLRDNENIYGIVLKPGEVPTRVKRETYTMYSDDPSVQDVLVFKRFVPGAKELFLVLPVPGNSAQTVVFKIKTEDFGGAAAAANSEKGVSEDDSTLTENNSGSPIVSESAPAEDFNPEDDDEYSEINGVSEAAQKKDQEEADAELKALNLGD